MARRPAFWLLVVTLLALTPFRSPAPLVFIPGEGWYYESYGENSKWQRPRAKDQLQVAEDAFKAGDYSTTVHATHRILRVWPLSDYAPRAEYLVGRCLEHEHKDEAAFNAYQNIIEKYPKSGEYNEVLLRQYEIANRFLGGQFFRLWNTIPLYSSMPETAKLYEKIVNNGPFSAVAPHAQLRIGAANEKGKDYADAVRAYELAADRYHDQPDIASDAMYRAGVSWQKQADTAEYDQSAAAKAIAAYTDFITFYPDDKRVADAQSAMVKLKAEQVRGSFQIAKYYESNHKWAGAVVYYNDVLSLDANSPLALQARQRIDVLKPRLSATP
ncbi:MAG TPA: outer membrane protein assembly factor BamD [Candidatus Acidoferrales bacterium]|jgi:outer membrane protein assembly factor BamD|nr:outer membrane protein assembly factor BamD [Candidatus Acidoferrales bacterium]